MKLYRYLTGPDDATFCRRVTESLSRYQGAPAPLCERPMPRLFIAAIITRTSF
jgi:hypothetical protein